jgi:hypothetical protein
MACSSMILSIWRCSSAITLIIFWSLFWLLLVGWFEQSETQRSLAIVGFGELIGNRFLSDSESQPTNTIFWGKVIL